MNSEQERPRYRQWFGVMRLLAGAAVVGSLFEHLGIPAGMLLGSALGAGLVNQPVTPRMRPATFPRAMRQTGLIAIGFVSGVMLTVDSLVSTAAVALPVVAAYLALGILNLVFITLLMSRYRVDPATAVLTVTPGGLSEVSSLAVDKGAQLGVVLTVHAVRLFALVFLVLPILLTVLA
ncbi:AbrB family transcriptional regulator [Prauserella alba]|nr:AbrB family transcriptional regulator [Prauserella alba]